MVNKILYFTDKNQNTARVCFTDGGILIVETRCLVHNFLDFDSAKAFLESEGYKGTKKED